MKTICGLSVPISLWFIFQCLTMSRVAADTKGVCLGYDLILDCNNADHIITVHSLKYGVNDCTDLCCFKEAATCQQNVRDILSTEYNGIIQDCQGKDSCIYNTQNNIPALENACVGQAKYFLLADYSCAPVPTTTTQPPPTTQPLTTTRRTTRLIPTTISPETTTLFSGSNPKQEGLSTGALIGIIVGVVCVIILVVVIVIVLIKRRKQTKPPMTQFPPEHKEAGTVPVQSGRDEIYGFLPGATGEPDTKRANRTSAFIKENQANGAVDKSNGKTKDSANVVIKNETKSGKKKSNNTSGKHKSKADSDGGARPKSSGVQRESSQNRKVPNVLAPGETRRYSKPKEAVPHYDNPRKSRSFQPPDSPADNKLVPDAAAAKSDSPKTSKDEGDKKPVQVKQKDSNSKSSKQDAKKASSVPKIPKDSKVGGDIPEKTNISDKKTPQSELEKKQEPKKGDNVIGTLNPAFDTEDHDDSDEGSATKSSC